MAERNIRHVENVFTDDEKKNKMGGLFKNKKAPQPPAGQKPLPKIGNYQPKMALDSKGPGSSHNERVQTPGHAQRRSRSSGDYRRSNSDVGRQKSPSPPPRRKREFIIGDKNIPITIERTIDEEGDDPVPPPRRKRRAPSVPEDDELRRNHSMYERSASHRSDKESLARDFEVQGGEIDFSPGIDNPGFRSRDRRISERSDRSYERNGSEQTGSRRNVFPEPAPDYDDEEVTINFDETTDELVLHYRNSNSNTRSQVCKDIEGEDFGQYMQEDDYEFDNPPYANGHMYARPRKEGKYQKGPKPTKKSNKKQMQLNNKRNTIRDFTFSDSKIGWGDRTVKSTSAKGRNIKREKERNRMDVTEHFNNRGPTPGSYEEFLSVKNGIPMESPNSSDSGVEVEDNGRPRSEGSFYDKQPKHLRSGGRYEHKPSMWQRLTWRFKRTVEITSADGRY